MKLSIVIPVYNEEKTLEAIYNKMAKVIYPTEEVEFIFVDDCSKDKSAEIIKKLASSDNRIKFVLKEFNSGKGSALAKGFEALNGDIVIIQDADMEYDPNEIPSLVKLIISDKADIVYGSRYSSMSTQVLKFYHYLGNKILTFFSNCLSNIHLSDMETCYKCMRADIIKNIVIQSQRFGFEPEVTAKIAKLNVRIHELPISYHERSYSEGKKIGYKDGFEALWCIIKYNLLTQKADCFKPTMPEQYLLNIGLFQ